VPDQRRLKLDGYPGGFDLVGNWVNHQFQLDAFGESLLLLAAAAGPDRLDAEGWRAVEVAAAAVERRWQEPDAGIWEIDNQAWTHSRLTCVAGLRAVARARGRTGRKSAAGWSGPAAAILAHTARHGLHPSGRWQRSSEDPRLDAALLLPPLRGALDGDDPRTLATLEAYLAELTDDGYAYRFRHDERPLGEAEGAFLLCGFMVALSLHQRAGSQRRCDGTSAMVPHGARETCSARSTTRPSDSCGGTFPRLSCMPCTSSAPPALRAPR